MKTNNPILTVFFLETIAYQRTNRNSSVAFFVILVRGFVPEVDLEKVLLTDKIGSCVAVVRCELMSYFEA
jgi:hypothetical protein